jgi:hypothetical protein
MAYLVSLCYTQMIYTLDNTETLAEINSNFYK